MNEQEKEFSELPENMQKYYNYREQMSRLKKAMDSHFYLESVFIEYAVMEDRLGAFLKTAGVFNPEKHKNIGKKINRLKELVRNPKNPISKYLSPDILDKISDWKEKRNPLIHELMKQNLTTEGLSKLAEEGREIIKILNSKSTSYRRYMERQEEKCPNS